MQRIKRIMLLIGLMFCGFCALTYSNTLISKNKKLAALDHHTNSTLNIAWDAWFPYQFLNIKNLQSSLTGLDVELVKLFAKDAEYNLNYKPTPWAETIPALKEGKIDMAAGATYSEDRAEYVYFSRPYRYEEDSLYVSRAKRNQYTFKTVDEFIDYMKHNPFKLGILKNNIYSDPKMTEFIENPSHSNVIVILRNYSELLESLFNNEIDGFLAERIIASSLIWQENLGKKVSEHYLKMKAPIHIVFSKKTVSESTVNAFNKSIDQLYNSVQYKQIFSWYLYPIIMVQTTGEEWFKMLDLLGTLFFSISGVIIAYSLNNTLLAAFVYAFLPSMSGFILRDVIFNQSPIEVLSSPEYMFIVCSTVIFLFIIIYLYSKVRHFYLFKHPLLINKIVPKANFYVNQILVVCDALGLASLTISGVMISLMARAEPLWLWGPFFAFISAAFGVIIRDILSKKECVELAVGEIYSEIAIVWGLFFSLALVYFAQDINPDVVRNIILVTVSGALFTRLFVYYFEIHNVHFN